MIPISFFLFFFLFIFFYIFLYIFFYFFLYLFFYFFFFINQIIMCTCDLYIIISMFRSNYSLSLSCTWPSLDGQVDRICIDFRSEGRSGATDAHYSSREKFNLPNGG